MAVLMNEVHSTVLAAASAATVLIHANLMSTILRFPIKLENFAELSVIYSLGMNCLLYIFVYYGGESTFYEKSREIAEHVKYNMVLVRQKSLKKEFRWQQKFYRSCPTLRVKLGSVNYFDEFTPLVLLNNGNAYIINFLMIGKT